MPRHPGKHAFRVLDLACLCMFSSGRSWLLTYSFDLICLKAHQACRKLSLGLAPTTFALGFPCTALPLWLAMGFCVKYLGRRLDHMARTERRTRPQSPLGAPSSGTKHSATWYAVRKSLHTAWLVGESSPSLPAFQGPRLLRSATPVQRIP